MIWADVSLPSTEFQLLGLHLTPTQGVVIGGMVVALFVIAHVTDSLNKARHLVLWAVGKVRARRMRREAKAAERVTEAVIAQIEPPDYAEKIDRLEERIDALEQRDDVASAWRIFDSLWHEEDEMERVENGHPIKPRLTYRDFAAKYYAGERYFNGVWTKIV